VNTYSSLRRPRTNKWAAALIVFSATHLSASKAQESLALDKYTCADFVSDSGRTNDGPKLIRSLAMISWATGYAAAHQKDIPRADAAAMQLIAATLGDICRASPEIKAVQAITTAIQQFARADTGSRNSAQASAAPLPSNSRPEFTKHDSSDIYSGDYKRAENIDVEACAALCSSDDDCKAYSYDKWNRFCFLKNQTGPLLLEPSSIVGVRAGIQIARANSAAQIDKRPNRGLVGKVESSRASANFDSCKAACTNSKSCVSFSYVKSGNQCQLYSSVDDHKSQEGVDSGIKRQAP